MLHSLRISILSGALYHPRVRQWQLLHPCTEILPTGLPRAFLPGKQVPFVEPATGPFQLVVASTDTWRCIGHSVSSMPATSAPRSLHGLVISPHICASRTGHNTHVVSDASATPKQSYLPAEIPICFLCCSPLICVFTSHSWVLLDISLPLVTFIFLSKASYPVCPEQNILGLTTENPSFVLLSHVAKHFHETLVGAIYCSLLKHCHSTWPGHYVTAPELLEVKDDATIVPWKHTVLPCITFLRSILFLLQEALHFSVILCCTVLLTDGIQDGDRLKLPCGIAKAHFILAGA